MNELLFNDFTNLYKVSKTLRFELVPIGESLNYINKKGILQQDEQRADEYKMVKKIIDEYHKQFINESLENITLEGLQDYKTEYENPKKEEKKIKDIEKKLRNEIVSKFRTNSKWKNLFGKELIQEELLQFETNEENKRIIGNFKKFTTYFTGFYDNRENMYSNEEKGTAIAHRLINENLTKFIDNIKIFKKVNNSTIKNNFENLLNEIKPRFNKIRNISTIEEIFSISFFNQILNQQGIDDYNCLIGGYTSEKKDEKIKGLNEYINLYNQQQQETKTKIPKLKPLFKQILSDRNTISWLPEQFNNGNELLENIEKYYQELILKVFEGDKDNKSLVALLQNIHDYDLSKILIKKDSLTDLSQKIFGDWSVFQNAIQLRYDKEHPLNGKTPSTKWKKEREESCKKFNLSISYLQECLQYLDKEYSKKNIAAYFAQLQLRDKEENIDLKIDITQQYEKIKNILNTPTNDNDLKNNVAQIKLFLDSIKNLQHFIKPLFIKQEAEKDELFYSEFDELYKFLNGFNKLYDKVRNYITKKPYSIEKIKINFEKSTLLNGWDVNKETDNRVVLFKKDECYFLGIMDVQYNNIFKNIPTTSDDTVYQKMNYKLLPGANKMLPKVFFSEEKIGFFNPSQEIINIRNHASHTKGGKPQEGFLKKEFNINDCRAMISFYIESLNKHEEWKNFNFVFKDINKYNTIDEFYRDVENQGYKINFIPIATSHINQLVAEGKLYLFKIYNKDFSNNSKGNPNLHTLYWKMLFDETNLKNVVYQLNGEAEIFYRKGSVLNKPTHPKNVAIKNKNELNTKKESIFQYDIIKNKRYTENKFFFHVPITLNFKANSSDKINDKVKNKIKIGDINHIIGIDRGERHLLYIVVINLQGEIVEQYSLNEITNKHNEDIYKINYQQLLDKREVNRYKQRESWETIENIKELKEGYLSQVVHQITSLILKYNAIVILENLNIGFKRGREKVEKQVYQKFEKMLIDKLNYLVNKNKPKNELSGVLKALQLSTPFESFKNIGRHAGFLFYVIANYTSKIDPTTGFVNLLYPKYEAIEKAQEFFNKFSSIKYNEKELYFEFVINNYGSFNPKAKNIKQDWTICTFGKRLENYRNDNRQWDTKEIDITKELKEFFDNNKILYTDGSCFKNEIIAKNDATFFKKLFCYLNLTLQMRNSKPNTQEDWMISPIKNSQGFFYDSRENKPNLPKDADANGAYHIALKGLQLLNKIKDHNCTKLVIENEEWLQYMQNI